MPMHDFSHYIDRTDTGSAKWEAMRRANPAVPPGIPPFSVADSDLPNAPEIIAGLQQYLGEAVLGYTGATAAYTEAVIGWMQRRHAWRVQADWIVPTGGVVPALCTAVRALTAPGDGVIVQPPVYYPFYGAVERNGRRLLRNPLVLHAGRYEIDFAQLRKLAAEPSSTMLLLCSPHNPVGRVWTREELAQLAEIVLAHDLMLVSDEIHFDVILPGHRHTVAASLSKDLAARSVICTAPSKSFNLAGMQASNIVIPDAGLRRRFVAELHAGGQFFLNALAWKACELAYTQGEPWLDGLLALVGRNHQLVRDCMAARLPKVRVIDLEGTYLQWLDFRGLGHSAAELQTLHEQQALVFFDEGPMFGAEGAGFERMNLAAPTAAVAAALERLARCHGGG